MRRDVADGAVQSGVVIPVDPLQCFPPDLADRFPSAEELDHLGLEQADDAFGQSIVIGIPDTADRGVDPRLSQPLGVSDRQVLAASVAVMDQLVRLRWCPLADGLVQGIQHETGRHRGGDTPADDLAGEDVDHEGDIDHTLPARDIGEIVVHWARTNGTTMNDPRAGSAYRQRRPGSPCQPGRVGLYRGWS